MKVGKRILIIKFNSLHNKYIIEHKENNIITMSYNTKVLKEAIYTATLVLIDMYQCLYEDINRYSTDSYKVENDHIYIEENRLVFNADGKIILNKKYDSYKLAKSAFNALIFLEIPRDLMCAKKKLKNIIYNLKQ